MVVFFDTNVKNKKEIIFILERKKEKNRNKNFNQLEISGLQRTQSERVRVGFIVYVRKKMDTSF